MSRLHDNKKRDRIYHHPCTAAVDHIMTEIVLCPLYYNDAICEHQLMFHESMLYIQQTDRVRTCIQVSSSSPYMRRGMMNGTVHHSILDQLDTKCVCNVNDVNGWRGCGMSVFVYLMRGEYDSILKWPFRGAITIQLVNHKNDRDHYQKTVHFNDAAIFRGAGRE